MLVALIVIVGYGVYRVATGNEPNRSAERAAAPAVKTAAPSPSHSGAIAQAPRTKVTIRVKARRASWLNVRDSKNRELYSGVVREGQVEEWTAKKRIRLVIGNGGGLRLTVNGKDIGYPGDPGQVVRLSFGPTDPQKG